MISLFRLFVTVCSGKAISQWAKVVPNGIVKITQNRGFALERTNDEGAL